MTAMAAVATAILGLVGASIAFMQWRTAQQKVVLDILKSRFEIYQEFISIIGVFQQEAKLSIQMLGKFLDAQRRARFHFGPEVDAYLDSLRYDMIRGNYFDRVGHQANISEDEYTAVFGRINAAYVELDKLFIPYMRIDQRMPQWWWPSMRETLKDILRTLRRYTGL